jgi:hypothetical protein|tara:strand:+ start:1680 stop:1862 length:183 start_codon:yes stop_codon:yes gene_type:complete
MRLHPSILLGIQAGLAEKNREKDGGSVLNSYAQCESDSAGATIAKGRLLVVDWKNAWPMF